ncbi:MAG: acetyltransferase [Akkermansiaceae bacterium]|nr:acetyltransferase [Armatimonadota bacterium]
MKSLSWARGIISFIAVFTSLSPYLADWNETHIYNPYWPPHAKFHNAQTMIFGAMAGLISLWFLWSRQRDRVMALQVGTLFAAFYWVTQSPAIFFPGASFTDPQFEGLKSLRIGPLTVTQLMLDFVIVGILFLAYGKERRRLRTASISTAPVNAIPQGAQ